VWKKRRGKKKVCPPSFFEGRRLHKRVSKDTLGGWKVAYNMYKKV